jgi:hypothetical protein
LKSINALLKNTLTFLLLLFILDVCLGEGLRFLYLRRGHLLSNRGLFNIFERTNAPVLVFGSSRAKYGYVPSRFQSLLKASCFNVGYERAFIEYHEAILEAVLKRYLPKMIILDIRPNEFVKTKIRLQSLSRLLPFYWSHPEIRKSISLRGIRENIKMLSHIYPYNSEIVRLIISNIRREDHPEYQSIKDDDGYEPRKCIWAGPIENEIADNRSESFDRNAIQIFKEFIDKCKNRNIMLFVIVAPEYIKNNGSTDSMEMAASICKNKGVPYLNLLNINEFLLHPEYFSDPTHLNDTGARIYTDIVIERIKETPNAFSIYSN